MIYCNEHTYDLTDRHEYFCTREKGHEFNNHIAPHAWKPDTDYEWSVYKSYIKIPLEATPEQIDATRIHEEMHAAAQKPCGLTFAQLAMACKNIGFDITCGSCAMLFFTGYTGPTSRCDMMPNDHDSHCETIHK